MEIDGGGAADSSAAAQRPSKAVRVVRGSRPVCSRHINGPVHGRTRACARCASHCLARRRGAAVAATCTPATLVHCSCQRWPGRGVQVRCVCIEMEGCVVVCERALQPPAAPGWPPASGLQLQSDYGQLPPPVRPHARRTKIHVKVRRVGPGGGGGGTCQQQCVRATRRMASPSACTSHLCQPCMAHAEASSKACSKRRKARAHTHMLRSRTAGMQGRTARVTLLAVNTRWASSCIAG